MIVLLSILSTASPAGLVTACESGCEDALIARQTLFPSPLPESHSTGFLLSSPGERERGFKVLLLNESTQSEGFPEGLHWEPSSTFQGLGGMVFQSESEDALPWVYTGIRCVPELKPPLVIECLRLSSDFL